MSVTNLVGGRVMPMLSICQPWFQGLWFVYRIKTQWKWLKWAYLLQMPKFWNASFWWSCPGSFSRGRCQLMKSMEINEINQWSQSMKSKIFAWLSILCNLLTPLYPAVISSASGSNIGLSCSKCAMTTVLNHITCSRPGFKEHFAHIHIFTQRILT